MGRFRCCRSPFAAAAGGAPAAAAAEEKTGVHGQLTNGGDRKIKSSRKSRDHGSRPQGSQDLVKARQKPVKEGVNKADAEKVQGPTKRPGRQRSI